MTAPSSPADDLDGLLLTIWRALEEATSTRTAYTHGALATVDADGAPRVRTVILRRCAPERGTLHLATDARSAKVAEIEAEPRVELLLHDGAAGTQLRLGCSAAAVTDPVERAGAWESLRPGSRELYASPRSPGRPLDETPTTVHGSTPFDRFAWVLLRVDRIDHLDLGADEHRRTLFQRDGDTWRALRLAP